MKKFLLCILISLSTLVTFNSCDSDWWIDNDECIEYVYYDYLTGNPVIYRGGIPYYVTWGNGYIFSRISIDRYGYIRRYPYPHFYGPFGYTDYNDYRRGW